MLTYEVKYILNLHEKVMLYFRHGLYHRVSKPAGVWENGTLRYARYGKLC